MHNRSMFLIFLIKWLSSFLGVLSLFTNFFADNKGEMPDLNKIEIYIFGCLVFLTLFFGVYPEPLFNTINVSVDNLINQYQADINFYLTEANN